MKHASVSSTDHGGGKRRGFTSAGIEAPKRKEPRLLPSCRGPSCCCSKGAHGDRRPGQVWQVFGGGQGCHAIPAGAAKVSAFCRFPPIESSLRCDLPAFINPRCSCCRNPSPRTCCRYCCWWDPTSS